MKIYGHIFSNFRELKGRQNTKTYIPHLFVSLFHNNNFHWSQRPFRITLVSVSTFPYFRNSPWFGWQYWKLFEPTWHELISEGYCANYGLICSFYWFVARQLWTPKGRSSTDVELLQAGSKVLSWKLWCTTQRGKDHKHSCHIPIPSKYLSK